MTATVPMSRRSLLAALAAAALAAGCAAPSGTAMGRSGPRLAPDDYVLAMYAAGGGLYEVEAGRLAVQRATRPEVRSYGQMLVDHHTPANAELAALLQAHGVTPAAQLPATYAMRLQRLAALPAADFDAGFLQIAGIQDHAQQIGLFQQADRELRDTGLRAWFARTLPSLRAHQDAARTLAATLAP